MTTPEYNILQPHIQTGDLIEWRGYSPISVAIRFFTGKEVNHSSLVVRLPYDGEERRFVIEALGSGLEFKLLSDRLEHHKGEAWWYQLKPEFETKRNRIGCWAFNQLAIQRGYDYKSIFKQIFGRVSVDARRWFCSEVIAAAYQENGIIPPQATALRPGEFAQFGIFESMARIK